MGVVGDNGYGPRRNVRLHRAERLEGHKNTITAAPVSYTMRSPCCSGQVFFFGSEEFPSYIAGFLLL